MRKFLACAILAAPFLSIPFVFTGLAQAQTTDACRPETIKAMDLSEQLKAKSEERAVMRAALDQTQQALAAAQKELAELKAKPGHAGEPKKPAASPEAMPPSAP